MLGSKFVGREALLDQLRDLAIRAMNNHGSTLFIEATAGMGTSALLHEFEERIHEDPELNDTVLISVELDRFGVENAYSPFVEILDSFETPKLKHKEIRKKALEIIKETAPDWLDMLPAVGPMIKAVAKTAFKAADITLTKGNGTQTDKGIILTNQYVNTILKIAADCKLLILVILDAHYIDNASCQLLLRLGRRLQEHNLALILTYNPEYVDKGSLLDDVKSKMVERDIAENKTLEGWSVEEINDYLCTRFGGTLHPHLAGWLRDLCNGEPRFITVYLTLLKENNIIEEYSDGKYGLKGQIKYTSGKWIVEGPLENVLPSKDINDLIQARIKNLQVEEREILQVGAVQGERFMSTVVEKLLAKQKNEIIRCLMQIQRQRQLISQCTDTESLRVRSDVYAFVIKLIQKSLYNELPPAYRMDSHRDIAKTLEEILNNNPQAIPNRKLMLQIAEHYDLGDESLLAARYYLQSAQSTFYNGALKETSGLCQRALEKIRSLPENISDYDKLRAEIIQLQLNASWWQGKPKSGSNVSEEEMIEEAEAAASRYSSVSGDRALLAKIKYLKGRIFVHTRNLGDAVEVLKEALKIAQDAQDSLAQFFIMSELGHLIVGNRSTDINMTFKSGLELQHKAYDLFVRNSLKSQVQLDMVADLNVHLYRCMARIGIGEFDGGNYDEAIKWILNSIKGLKELNRIEDLSRALYFLGQVYTAIGLFEDAEKYLHEAIDLYKDEEGPIYLRDNTKAFLGKLYIEWRRIANAEKPLKEGWKGFKDAWSADMVAVVTNYYIELLMHPDYEGGSKNPQKRLENLRKAEDLLQETIMEVKKTKFYRSAIVALSLWGKLDLLQGDISSAVKHSTEAVQYLEEMGTMPLVRMEEIFFNHYSILKTIEHPDAKNYLYRAYEILQRKADSLKNEEYRHTFLKRVPLSQEILSAVNS